MTTYPQCIADPHEQDDELVPAPGWDPAWNGDPWDPQAVAQASMRRAARQREKGTKPKSTLPTILRPLPRRPRGVSVPRFGRWPKWCGPWPNAETSSCWRRLSRDVALDLLDGLHLFGSQISSGAWSERMKRPFPDLRRRLAKAHFPHEIDDGELVLLLDDTARRWLEWSSRYGLSQHQVGALDAPRMRRPHSTETRQRLRVAAAWGRKKKAMLAVIRREANPRLQEMLRQELAQMERGRDKVTTR